MILWWAAVAFAARPDSGSGLYAFEDEDVLEFVDGPEGAVRVHYSIEGPNDTLLDDDDSSGFPDFPEEVAATAEEVIDFYADQGFLAPLSEADLGLGDLGGSEALDFYLVDFAGTADGLFAVDACEDGVCSGYMVMENDFYNYGYPSLSEAIRVLTSHELFHGVQYAYSDDEPSWFSEGSAVWAEYQFDNTVDDFVWLCNAYLEDTGRSIDRPPSGAITAFSYGTALFFQFLTERFGPEIGPALQTAMQDRDAEDAILAIEEAISAEGGTLTEEWTAFAQWNLATGDRAGLAESYPFADDLDGIAAEMEGDALHDDNRFYPLAATYYLLDHPGGELFFATADDSAGVVFSLHPVADGAPDGPVEEAIAEWSGVERYEFGDLPAGGYWMVGTYPEIAEQSVKLEFCLGAQDAAAACAAEDTDPPNAPEDPGGCACGTTTPSAAGSALVLAFALFGRLRRRTQ